MSPLLTLEVHDALRAAARAALASVGCSLDLQWSTTTVEVGADDWAWQGQRFAWMENCRDRTIYRWTQTGFEPVARFSKSLIKLVPTQWGAPTFEIDGIKMLPTSQISPYADAQRKVALIEPRGKVVLDTCGGLGYFAAWCLKGKASRVLSYEKNADVLWLRSLNPWSPAASTELILTEGDITEHIRALPRSSIDAVLHDPPRFGIAGELYAQDFYEELARVLKPGGKLFHYIGTPNRLSGGRDVPKEVSKRLGYAGFATQPVLDGVIAVKRQDSSRGSRQTPL
jgi:predicted methyltransferase